MKFIQKQNYTQCYARSPFCCGKPMSPTGGNAWWCSICNCTIEFS